METLAAPQGVPGTPSKRMASSHRLSVSLQQILLHKKKEQVEDQDYFLKTIKTRGFANKLNKEQVVKKAKVFSYDVICEKIEDLMQSYVESKCQYSFATFIVTTLLHRTN